MAEYTSSFNVFPVFFRGKTDGFGGMRGGHSLGKPRRVGKEQRAASSGRNRGRKWRRGAARHFLRRIGTPQINTKTPLLMERGLRYLNSDEF